MSQPSSSRADLAVSLLQALGEEGDSVAAEKLREEIERLEQEEAELLDYEDEDEDMVSCCSISVFSMYASCML